MAQLTKSLRGAISTLVLAALLVPAIPAQASGDFQPGPWYLDPFGGDPKDQARFYAGQPGVIMAQAPRARLYMAWRLLHGNAVGPIAGRVLAVPCCTEIDPTPDGSQAAWIAARKTVPGAEAIGDSIDNERTVDGQQVAENCFTDAFHQATLTLNDRIARYGAASPGVKAWLAAQDAVFAGCSGKARALPAEYVGAPAWLRADRAYQAGALSLYLGSNQDAANRFYAIARDSTSPWQAKGTYLAARALEHEALDSKDAADIARARLAIAALEHAPEPTFGRDQAPSLRHILDFRFNKEGLRAELGRTVQGRTLDRWAAAEFYDYSALNPVGADRSWLFDWIDTFKALQDKDDVGKFEVGRVAALAHARQLWGSTHDLAWLIAALSLANPDEPAATALARDAAAVPSDSPAYLTAAYHRVRLTLPTGNPAAIRRDLDRTLARKDLSISDRNLFLGQRLQVAENLHAMVRYSLRARLCDGPQADACPRSKWTIWDEPRNIYDPAGKVGFGADARLLIDRMPLSQRMAFSADKALPKDLKLDVDLTSWTRAVLLQDNKAIDTLSQRLKTELPQLASDWAKIVATKPGADKRFAEYVILGKIPRLRVDLTAYRGGEDKVPDDPDAGRFGAEWNLGYERPVGKVASFDRGWTDWVVLKRPAAQGEPGWTSYYDGYDSWGGEGGEYPDLACLGYCGRGSGVPTLPAPLKATAAQAARERGYLHGFNDKLFIAGKPADRDARLRQYGGVAVWDEMLTWIEAHPRDPRAAESLYWLVRISRFGEGHNHSSHRAFTLLHRRYAGTSWAKKSEYYFD
jgi:hypothetical protein